VVAVSTTGEIRALNGGSAIITVTSADGGFTDTCSVTVNVPVTGATLNKSATTLAVGATETLTATVSPADASNQQVSWTSDNVSVATVNNSGVITAVGAGSTSIKVKSADGSYSDSCTVTVIVPVTGVSLNKAATTLDIGTTETLIATVAPAGSSNSAVTWSSSSSAIASVNSAGVVTASSVGTATITVTTADGGFTDSCEVTVTGIPVTGISFDSTALTVEVGKTVNLPFITVTPANASNPSYTVSSSNSLIAETSLDEFLGIMDMITGTGVGTCTVTVTSDYNPLVSDAISITVVADTTAPTSDSTLFNLPTEILVSFSEALDITSAENVSNYSISGISASISSATLLNPFNDTVKLILDSSAPANAGITLSISGIQDPFGNVITAIDIPMTYTTTLAFDTLKLVPGAGNSLSGSAGAINLTGITDTSMIEVLAFETASTLLVAKAAINPDGSIGVFGVEAGGNYAFTSSTNYTLVVLDNTSESLMSINRTYTYP